MKPIIGIVGRINDDYIGIKDEVRNAVIKCGGIPISILPTKRIEYNNVLECKDILTAVEENDLISEIKLCDGIIMPGGSLIFNYDKFICKYAIDNNIPILGICLGMQIMATYINDSLKHIDNENHNTKDLYVHSVTTRPNSILNDIFGDFLMVNSRHNEQVIKVGDYIITAISEDDIIEGIEYPFNTFNVGVQWHPESMIEYDKKQFELMKLFISKCIKFDK